LFTLNSLFDAMPLGLSEKLKSLFLMIRPILNYGCAILGFYRAPDVEEVNDKLLEQN
jgi:hypothetical protein